MNTHSSITAEEALEAEGPSDPDGERAEQLLRVLARLTELGMVLAERLVAQATADETAPVDVGEVGTAFAKVSRGVRMTVMLEAKLAKERRMRPGFRLRVRRGGPRRAPRRRPRRTSGSQDA